MSTKASVLRLLRRCARSMCFLLISFTHRRTIIKYLCLRTIWPHNARTDNTFAFFLPRTHVGAAQTDYLPIMHRPLRLETINPSMHTLSRERVASRKESHDEAFKRALVCPLKTNLYIYPFIRAPRHPVLPPPLVPVCTTSKSLPHQREARCPMDKDSS